jgi:serine/threonine-protein kinase
MAATSEPSLSRLLDEALALAPDQRLSWVDSLPGELAALKPRLRTLLARSIAGESRARLDTLPHVGGAGHEGEPMPATGGAAHAPGVIVGGHRLVRRLGAGAMGVVWLAHARGDAGPSMVALKFAHMAERRHDLLVRLARERHLLAALDHPNIARLYDAGVTPEGQPYLVLEYVEGEPLDDYCAAHEPDLEQRLALFLQIAEAVAHAHERQIVHRDLKPANVLVTAAGHARLLDFGIGQLLADGLPQGLLLSMITGRPLTLAYASPEQVLGDRVGFGSDIYSLGVMLYELLTGSRPHASSAGSTRALRDAILFAKVPAPSTLVSDPAMQRRLRSALDEITLQALNKRPQQRQPSARLLAEQVKRGRDLTC